MSKMSQCQRAVKKFIIQILTALLSADGAETAWSCEFVTADAQTIRSHNQYIINITAYFSVCNVVSVANVC